MNTKKVSSITKVFLLALFLAGTIFTANSNSTLLAKTAAYEQIYGPSRSNDINSGNTNSDCDGLWINTDTTKKIYLNAIYLKDWGANSNPSLILDTYNQGKNFLIIGHNICINGECNSPRSQFANIMKLNIGDKVSVCLGGILFTGYVFTSSPIPDTKTNIMGDWTGFNTITMFTSYGNCKDTQCSSTNQRWMVALERSPRSE